MTSRVFCVLGFLVGLIGAEARADVGLGPLFGDHMVLQRDVAANIWGTAAPGESVTITVDKQSVNAVTGTDGQWMTKLPVEKAGGPFEVVISGSNTLRVEDVYFGDVWLCSGQSNMEFNNQGILKPDVFKAESAAANDPQLRFFVVQKNVQHAPVRSLGGQWQPSTPESMAAFSATGYFMGRELRRKLGVPIGLIGSYWGGTAVEAFTSIEALEKDPAYKRIKQTWEFKAKAYPLAMKVYDGQVLPQWKQKADAALASGTTAPPKPWVPGGGPGDNNRPGVLFNGMIEPLIPYSLKGIAWYQGESNADTIAGALEYRTLFPTMIRDWRARWGSEVPFVWVQLANFRAEQTHPVETTNAWPYLREAQTMTLSLPATGMSSALGNDNPATIHPKDKITVGKRLADVALAVAYGWKIPHTGPLYTKMTVKGDAARLSFANADGGLAVSGEKLKGFAIAGADGKFMWGDARIEKDAVIVSSAQVPEPVSVRYSWADDPIGNLVNGAGLPASPFRTDVNTPPVSGPGVDFPP
jgi:sialate O-acetylesterase